MADKMSKEDLSWLCADLHVLYESLIAEGSYLNISMAIIVEDLQYKLQSKLRVFKKEYSIKLTPLQKSALFYLCNEKHDEFALYSVYISKLLQLNKKS